MAYETQVCAELEEKWRAGLTALSKPLVTHLLG